MNLVAVAVGGFFGAILRYTVESVIPSTDGFPTGTLLINLSGSLFLAWFFTLISKRRFFSPQLKLAIGTGLTGSFTTFSTFSVETLDLVNHHQYVLAVVYVFVSIFGGIGLAVVGAKLAVRKVSIAKQMEGESE